MLGLQENPSLMSNCAFGVFWPKKISQLSLDFPDEWEVLFWRICLTVYGH